MTDFKRGGAHYMPSIQRAACSIFSESQLVLTIYSDTIPAAHEDKRADACLQATARAEMMLEALMWSDLP